MAMAIVPALLVLIVILGRHMRGDPGPLEAKETTLAKVGNGALLALITVISLAMLASLIQPLAILPVLLAVMVGVAFLVRGYRLGKTGGDMTMAWLRWTMILPGAGAFAILDFWPAPFSGENFR